METALTPAHIMDILGLTPHATCGFVAQSYQSQLEVPAGVLPACYTGGGRTLGRVLYFLVTPQAPIRLHRIRSDQMYHHYVGGPLEVLLLYPDGRGEVRVVGPDLVAGMRPQLFIPGGTFHTSRLPPGSDYALLGTSVWLGVEPQDVEAGDPARLSAAYPDLAEGIAAFTGEVLFAPSEPRPPGSERKGTTP
jgi:predicted cupin superfamily sugar epimerase